MPDYGHDIEFGVFITPAAAEAGTVLELAQLCDVVGLDLVTFQDHPYQPSFLDSWTLLSFVAAQTRSVRVDGEHYRVHGASVQASVDLLTDALLSHFSYEERELIEPLARHGFY